MSFESFGGPAGPESKEENETLEEDPQESAEEGVKSVEETELTPEDTELWAQVETVIDSQPEAVKEEVRKEKGLLKRAMEAVGERAVILARVVALMTTLSGGAAFAQEGDAHDANMGSADQNIEHVEVISGDEEDRSMFSEIKDYDVPDPEDEDDEPAGSGEPQEPGAENEKRGEGGEETQEAENEVFDVDPEKLTESSTWAIDIMGDMYGDLDKVDSAETASMVLREHLFDFVNEVVRPTEGNIEEGKYGFSSRIYSEEDEKFLMGCAVEIKDIVQDLSEKYDADFSSYEDNIERARQKLEKESSFEFEKIQDLLRIEENESRIKDTVEKANEGAQEQ